MKDVVKKPSVFFGFPYKMYVGIFFVSGRETNPTSLRNDSL